MCSPYARSEKWLLTTETLVKLQLPELTEPVVMSWQTMALFSLVIELGQEGNMIPHKIPWK